LACNFHSLPCTAFSHNNIIHITIIVSRRHFARGRHRSSTYTSYSEKWKIHYIMPSIIYPRHYWKLLPYDAVYGGFIVSRQCGWHETCVRVYNVIKLVEFLQSEWWLKNFVIIFSYYLQVATVCRVTTKPRLRPSRARARLNLFRTSWFK